MVAPLTSFIKRYHRGGRWKFGDLKGVPQEAEIVMEVSRPKKRRDYPRRMPPIIQRHLTEASPAFYSNRKLPFQSVVNWRISESTLVAALAFKVWLEDHLQSRRTMPNWNITIPTTLLHSSKSVYVIIYVIIYNPPTLSERSSVLESTLVLFYFTSSKYNFTNLWTWSKIWTWSNIVRWYIYNIYIYISYIYIYIYNIYNIYIYIYIYIGSAGRAEPFE